MSGISSKAAGKLQNNKQYNGIEHTTDLNLNQYDAFYRTLDPQIGRFWQVDPEADAQESLSPYHSMDNNPISNVDPLGDFATSVGAWWNRLWHGGGNIGKNEYGEWYIAKNKGVELNDNGEVSATSYYYYGKGRDKYSNAAEALSIGYEIQQDIQMNGEKSMYTNYNSPREAGMAALSIGTGVLLPNPILKSATVAVNTTAKVTQTTNQLLLESQRMRMLRNASNPKLRSWITKLWREGAKFGDGSTGAMIKLEQSEGVVTSATGSHVQKAGEALAGMKDLLKGNYGNLSESDRGIIFEVIQNLTDGTGLSWKK